MTTWFCRWHWRDKNNVDTKIIDRTVRTQGLKSRSISRCCFIIQLGLRDFTRSLVRKNYQLHEYNYTLVYSMIIYLCKTFYFYYYGFWGATSTACRSSWGPLRIKHEPQQRPKLLQWQFWILNPLRYMGTLNILFFIFLFIFYGSLEARGRMGATVLAFTTATKTYAMACGNAGSLTHWVRTGIEPTMGTLCLVLNPLSHNGNSSTLYF